MLPKNGYRGWLCTKCGHITARGHWWMLECTRLACDSQHAQYVDEVQIDTPATNLVGKTKR